MGDYFSKTFFKFFFAFLIIIGAAFGVLIVASSLPGPVDNLVEPR